MKKRIVSVFLLIFILLNICVFADSTQSENKYYDMATSLIETVCSEDALPVGESNITVTRAEFVAALEKIMNINVSEATKVEYSDVPLTYQYSANIHTALQMGWISPALNFRPSDGILYSEAVKIICSALGYDVVAGSKGGYPAGYMKCASDMRLDNGISNYSAPLTKGEVAIILYNTLNARLYKQTGFGDVLQYAESDRTLAEEVYDLYRFEGVVSATPYNSLVSSTGKSADNTVKVNGIAYRYTDVKPDMLGKRYEFYICENSENPYNEIVWCYERYGNTKEVNLYDAYMKTADKLYAGGELVTLSSPYSLIYNGVKMSAQIVDYVGNPSCTATLIDADEDDRFETVSISSYDYIIVESVDVDGECIGGADRKSLDLSAKDCQYFIDGALCEDLAFVQKGLYAYTMSKDKKLVQFYKCDNSADMVMSGKTSEALVLDNAEYTMSKYFVSHYLNKVEFDVPITFYFGINGELVYMEKLTDDYEYGYLLHAKAGTGIEPKTEIKIYSEYGEMLRLPLAERAMINGKKITKKPAAYIESSDSAIIKKPQLVRYYTKDGKVTKIDTAEVSDSNNPIDYNRENNDDKLTEYVFDKYVYRSTSTSFAPYFSVELTTVFYIPEDLEDEEAFHISDNSAFSNSETYTNIRVYDVDITGNSPVIVMNVKSSESISRYDLTTYVVEKVSRVLNEDGEEVNVLHLWRNGSVIKLESPDRVSLTKSGGKTLSRGDIVSVYSYDGLTVSHLQVDFDVQTGKVNSETGIVHNSDSLSSKLSYNTGFVYNAGSSYIMLDKSTTADSTADFLQTNIRTLTLNYNSLRNVYVYDSEEKTVTAVSPAVIKTYLEYGLASADFAIVRHNLGLANLVYIYR